MREQLKFNDDGTFKILQLTDLHIGGDIENAEDIKTFQLIDELIEAERPDLIAITGDLIWSEGVDHPEISYRRVLNHINKWNIPFAVVYGNHDSEANITRTELFSIQKDYPNSLAQAGPSSIHGVGNYSLPIQSAKIPKMEAILYFLDSGSYAPKNMSGYEWIHLDQINWFVEESNKYARANEKRLPALAFFHIPLPEYKDVFSVGKISGIKNEAICSPNINSGLFAAMLEAGDVMGTFVGHDHDNDFCGELFGLSLCYGRVGGYNVYGDLERGARVIQLYEGKREFDSWILLGGGKVVSLYRHNEK
ncbi:metallophosphoesterase family protein [Bacillus sp. FJAT-49711]|uniref:metallophosphoesterase family protein n=1 Tax=Bacillus sp. FJAT-49711 TaxID=2833585 RepID=UPI001BC9A900|nr:metallophosphoesterase family protein [Bacillus sp. FJAT-49711]MBS4218597.1 metallophosphoesterase family protein [Bacillus sp. FJAT-49711]